MPPKYIHPHTRPFLNPSPYRGQIYFGGGSSYPTSLHRIGGRYERGGSRNVGFGHYELRGAGIGSVFTNVLRGVVPIFRNLFRTGAKVSRGKIAKKALAAAKKTGMKAGIKIVGDALKGENVIKSAKKRSKQAAQEMGDALAKSVTAAATASPAPKKRRRRKGPVTATPAAVVKRGRGRGGGGRGGDGGGGGATIKKNGGRGGGGGAGSLRGDLFSAS